MPLKKFAIPKLKFSFNILGRARTRVGLDIGNCNLKVIEIEEKKGAFRLVNALMKDVKQEKDIPAAIAALFKEAGIANKSVNISVSGEDVVARHLSLPKMNEGELKKALVFQLEDHIPFKADEVYTDYHVMGDEPNSKNRMRVFLVASKKALVEQRLKLVRQANLKPQVITTDALALKNAFYHNYPERLEANVALLNIGDKISNLIIAREKIPYFVRDTRFGGEMITDLIQTKAQVDKPAAESLKTNPQSATPEITEIIKTAMGSLLNEIFVSLDFYENLTEQRIDEIYITGGSSKLPGLKEFLSGYLNFKIIPLESLKNFAFSPGLSADALGKISHYLTVAIGLALEEA
ncbi:MAG: type IV pilus assembly protein PilM [Candidatus Omnitrophota bacterium]|nr:type IV pilus assembly protein PilM [Candidatus Omnitrophota bacterium]